MQKILTWAKAHKIVATGIGCVGVLGVGFVIVMIIGIILVIVDGPPAEDLSATGEPNTQQAPAKTTTAPPTKATKPTTKAPEPTKTTAPTQPTTKSAAPTKKPVPTKTKRAAPAKTKKAANSFAKKVEKTVLDAAAVDKFSELGSDSPAFAVTKVEDISSGTIRVYVQDSLTDDQSADVARWFMNMGCGSDDSLKLDTVVVRDTSGVDRNNFTSMMDPITLCQ